MRHRTHTTDTRTTSVWPHASKLGTYEVSVVTKTTTGSVVDRSTVRAADVDAALAKVLDADASPRPAPVAAIAPAILAAFSATVPS